MLENRHYLKKFKYIIIINYKYMQYNFAKVLKKINLTR